MIKYDVVGVGNAIVDILAKVDDDFIKKHGLTKASMALIDETEAFTLYDDMPPAVEKSGGSAANTLAGIASFGGSAAFIGKVKDDELGAIFRHDLRSIGVHYDTLPSTEGAATAKCLIAITPDAERTMSTFLGATKEITKNDISEEIVAAGKVTYLEGYLWDEPQAKEAMRCAVDIARKHDRKVALSLSDSFCVERHRDEFSALIKEGVDILFANEAEVKCLFETDNFDECVKKIKDYADIVAITLGAKGSIVIHGNNIEKIEPARGLKVVDTTGAGDLYASGFLYGYTHGYNFEQCGKLANLAASEIIQQVGARPESKLSELIKEAA
ncbi:MAG: adenosine kinase [Alphaproteobacteria bacterium CG11_big_fil_rev_8_21_14_0_20_39_49]|nr:MAG: adenosine kinase [Alphaproteobacteria bacterium CG11_big_fil_rev_8_21_14_0_20_39_49]